MPSHTDPGECTATAIVRNAKRSSTLLVVAFAVLFLLTDSPAIETVHGLSSGPPAGRTGAPGANGGAAEATCAACHFSSVQSGPAFTIAAPGEYIPGQTYQITVTHSTLDETRMKWGFQLTVLTADFAPAGTLLSTSSLTQVLTNQGDYPERQYIEHTIDGTFEGQLNGAVWTFNWVAPASNLGPVTFYAAGNQANMDFTFFGDEIYTTQATASPAVCRYNLSGSSALFLAAGGQGQVRLTTAANCAWTVSSDVGWIVLTSAASGSGSDEIGFEVRENSTGATRSGTLTIGDQAFQVIQDGGLGELCNFNISPLNAVFNAPGGTGSIFVFAASQCSWQATANVPWITITSGAIGTGNGAVGYSVATNPGPGGRKGRITIAGMTFSVKQKTP